MKPSTPLWLVNRFKNAVIDRFAALKTIEFQELKFYYLRSESPPHDPAGFAGSKLEFHHKVRDLSGGVAIDVGANVGAYTIRLAKKFGTVIAFEPEPRNARILRINVATNRLRNVRVEEAALSDTNGTVHLYVRGGGATSLNSRHYGLKYDKVISARVMRLDDLPEPPEKVDFLKIDAEGSEVSVLRGGRNTIEASMPIIGIEVHRSRMISKTTCVCETCAYLHDCGYVLEITGELTSPTAVHWVWATPETRTATMANAPHGAPKSSLIPFIS